MIAFEPQGCSTLPLELEQVESLNTSVLQLAVIRDQKASENLSGVV